jgi:DNA ligase-1
MMIRNPLAPYERKRTKNLLKWKIFKTATFPILAYQVGEGKNIDKLGAILFSLPGGGTGKVGTGFTDQQRINIFKTRPIGTVTIDYQELSPTGVPIFPSFKSINLERN